MDPASAIGIASSVLTFIDCGYKALKTCRQIWTDPQSATAYNKELEQSTRTIDELRVQLGATTRNKDTGRRIVDAAKECSRLAVQLLDLLRHVRGDGQNIGKLKGTTRALRHKKQIDDLQRSLEAREDVLGKILVQDTNVNIRAIRAELASSSQNVATLPRRMREMQRQTRNDIGTAHRNMHRRFDAAAAQAERLHQGARHQDQREKFLHALWYPEMDQRRNGVKDAAPSTFEWIYDMRSRSEDRNLKDTRTKHWDDFGDWLRNEHFVYWINGKPGSGKSTLMAFIANDVRTRQLLQEWSSGHPPHILSHFFWRAGSQAQQSVDGLLRSLLFQLCQAAPHCIDSIIQALAWSPTSSPSWTHRRLATALNEAIKTSPEIRCFLLIDGLDEFSGDCDALVNLIFELQAIDRVKCCVSSRPEAELRHRLASCQQLRLQDLNRPDIEQFVEKQCGNLARTGWERARLTSKIVDRAEGVFLWAVLVCRSIVRGDRSFDRFELLLERLNSLPTEIEDLFITMIRSIDPVYFKDRLPFYLQCMKLYAEDLPELPFFNGSFLSIAWLLHAFDERDASQYADLTRFAHQTEVQISSQSAGLLEVHADVNGVESLRDYHHEKHQALPDPSSCNITEPLQPTEQTRHQACMELLNTRHQYVVWVHRSAHDIVFTDCGKSLPLDVSQDSLGDTLKVLLQAALSWLRQLQMMAKDSCLLGSEMIALRYISQDVGTVVTLCGFFDKQYPQTTHQVMADLHSFCAEDESTDRPLRTLIEPYPKHRNPFLNAKCFWHECIEKFPEYVIRKWDQFVRDSENPSTMVVSLRPMMTIIGQLNAYDLFHRWVPRVAQECRFRLAIWLLNALGDRLALSRHGERQRSRSFLSTHADPWMYVATCTSSSALDMDSDPQTGSSFYGPLAQAVVELGRSRRVLSQVISENRGSSKDLSIGPDNVNELLELSEGIRASLNDLSRIFTIDLHELELNKSGYLELLHWSSNHTHQTPCMICGTQSGHVGDENGLNAPRSSMRLLCSSRVKPVKGVHLVHSGWSRGSAHDLTFELGDRSRELFDERLRNLTFEEMHSHEINVSEKVKCALAPEDLATFEGMVISEIWENKAGLDATEQLFALAFVRTRSYVWYRV